MFMLSGKNILLNMRGEHFERISEIISQLRLDIVSKDIRIKEILR